MFEVIRKQAQHLVHVMLLLSEDILLSVLLFPNFLALFCLRLSPAFVLARVHPLGLGTCIVTLGQTE